MLREIVLWLILFCAGWAAMADQGFAAGEPLKLKIIYSSFTGAYTPLWLAVDDRLGKKYVWISKPSTPAAQGRINSSSAATRSTSFPPAPELSRPTPPGPRT